MSYRQTFGPNPCARPLAQAIAVALALAYGASASAATLTVDVTTDTSNPGECSLRDAINASRTNAAVNGCAAGDLASGDTITFALALPASIALTATLPALQDGVTPQALVIQGPGAANLEIVISVPASILQSFTANPGPLTIDGLAFRAVGGAGAAVFYNGALTIRNAAVTGPFSSGVQAFNGGPLLIEDSSFSGTSTGAAISGGSGGALTVRGSTFTGNALGVDARSGFSGTTTATIENSTFDANTQGGFSAADVRAFGYGGTLTLNLRNTTLSGNTASRRVVLETSTFNGGTVNALVESSLFAGPAGSTDIDATTFPPPPPPRGAAGAKGLTQITTLTANNSIFSEDSAGIPQTSAGANNQFSVANPGLAALANNGGPTQTLALLASSPAIDTGSNPAALTNDQRGAGFPRTLGAATDVGAFESLPPQNVQVFDAGDTLPIADGDATPDAADGTDFGAAPIGTPVVRTYTIRNTGAAPLAISGISSDAGTFVVSGAPASVAAGASATFTVTFTPTASGAASATITVASDDPDVADAAYTFAVQGAGQALQNVQVFDPGNTLQIVDGDVTPAAADGTDFGATPLGTPVARTYTIRNTGELPLSINGITSSVPGAFAVSNVPASVAAGGTATFTVTYNAAAPGAANATITVASNDPDAADASYTYAVTGNALSPQNVQVFDPGNTLQIADGDVSPAAADGTDFGSTPVGTPVVRTYTIRNTGNQALNIGSIISSSAGFTVSGVPASVAALGTATFTVTYPAAAAGVANATITVNSNDPDPADASYTFAVTGTASTVQNVQVFDPGNTLQIADGDTTPSTPDGTDFGTTLVGTPVTRTYTIRNTGTQPLTINGITSGSAGFTVSGVPASVAGGGSATFTVTLGAGAAGAANATITVSSNDPDLADASYTFAVQGTVAGARDIDVFDGTGVTPIADGEATTSVSAGTDFGNVNVGGSLARSFTIRNGGGEPLSVTGIVSSNPAFVLSNVPASVPAGGSATFTVTFTPTAAGAANATVTITTNDPDASETLWTFAVQGLGGVATVVAPTVIPSLSGWALTLLAAMLAALGWRRRDALRVKPRA